MNARPRNVATTETYPHVLLVEGGTDEHVIGHLWGSKFNDEPPFKIIAEGSKGRALDSIGARIKVPGTRTIGIVVDADENAEDSWREVQERLSAVNVEVPAKPVLDGFVTRVGSEHAGTRAIQRLGIWVSPDNRSPGELEDILAAMMPEDDVVWPLAQAYADSVVELSPRAGKRLIQPHRKIHAAVWAWMASRRQPTRVGSAIRDGDLNVDVPLCQLLVAWLEKLFREVTAQDERSS